MREIVKYEDYLLFVYSFDPYYHGEFYDWVDEKKDDGFTYKTFNFDNNSILYTNSKQIRDDIEYLLPKYISNNHSSNDIIYVFKLGNKMDNLIYLDKEVFEIDYDFSFHKDFNIEIKHLYYDVFRSRTSSIIYKIVKNVRQEICISNVVIDEKNVIPFNVYENLIDNFPNSYHLSLYADSRIEFLIGQYLDIKKSKIDKFEKYLSKKELKIDKLNKNIYDYEIMKYKSIFDKLNDLLLNESISESEWQNEIIEILPLIYPEYIIFLKEVDFKISEKKKKILDYLVVDANGFVKIIELKKPFLKGIVSEGVYRDNHYPLRELSGSIMQIEKYIYYLNRKGESEEKRLFKKYQRELNGIVPKIVNPKGIIIAGRSNYFTEGQKIDFEIIKRKYSNIIEIITYDDLLSRLQNIIKNFENIISENNNHKWASYTQEDSRHTI